MYVYTYIYIQIYIYIYDIVAESRSARHPTSKLDLIIHRENTHAPEFSGAKCNTFWYQGTGPKCVKAYNVIKFQGFRPVHVKESQAQHINTYIHLHIPKRLFPTKTNIPNPSAANSSICFCFVSVALLGS